MLFSQLVAKPLKTLWNTSTSYERRDTNHFFCEESLLFCFLKALKLSDRNGVVTYALKLFFW